MWRFNGSTTEMNIVQITPGAGGMYCGNCFRDNALVAALRQQGHEVLMVPLYLPMTLDEEDQSRGTPIFFSGINVYLEQKSSFFRHAPDWLHHLLASPALLRWAAGKAAKTRPDELGELTISTLRGEAGNQSRELDDLMGQRLNLPSDRLRVVFNGISLEGYDGGQSSVVSGKLQRTTENGQRTIPVLGYFARMCREKGLDRLVEAFILLKRREGTKN